VKAMQQKILLWDNDGTVTGSKDPNDKGMHAKIILPGVEETMQKAEFNFIISGFKSPESELQNFDPDKTASKFIDLLSQLPISAAAFSPTIGGVACYVVIKKDGKFFIKKAHEEPRYKKYIGEFKKPGIGMFLVIRDLALEEFGQIIDSKSAIMIGDTWHDEMAAKTFGVPFMDAKIIHEHK
jgi:hypothetical protein